MKPNTLQSLTGPRGGLRAAADTIRRRGGTASIGYLAACSQCPGKRMAARIFRKHGVRANHKELNRLIMAQEQWKFTPALSLYLRTIDAKNKANSAGTKIVIGGYRDDRYLNSASHTLVLRSGRRSGPHGNFDNKFFSL